MLEEVKEDLEAAVLDFFEEAFDNCSSDRDVQSVNIVQWEQSLSCTEDGNVLQTKSTAKFNKKSIFHECDDRRLVGEDFEDVKKRTLVLMLMVVALKHAMLILLLNSMHMGLLML